MSKSEQKGKIFICEKQIWLRVDRGSGIVRKGSILKPHLIFWNTDAHRVLASEVDSQIPHLNLTWTSSWLLVRFKWGLSEIKTDIPHSLKASPYRHSKHFSEDRRFQRYIPTFKALHTDLRPVTRHVSTYSHGGNDHLLPLENENKS